MAKKKLQHFAENKTFAHYFEMPFEQLSPNGHPMRGNWKTEFFKNDNPLIIEIGCGKGEYTVGQAKYFPHKNFIGVDVKGARIWRGAKTIEDEKIKNAAFVRSQAGLLQLWFAPGEVDEIWITFPDPQPGCRQNKRLTSMRYLNMFKVFLKENGIVHLKTDSRELFDYTMEVISDNKLTIIERIDDLYAVPGDDPLHNIQTFYEKMWLEMGKKISYVAFQL
ncbi:MAG: tRNA (guanosine(46)-N7)-methyltransferase TrmB [Bacteroidetes bacterium GWF2_43_63]|nr:MAG: tRNA (guanosine(46)-N7)-methyltransferase TrmB [Bacteroidetes bacterium GWE2_42_42]OFY53141.1 MAG: tRNA (guanosine(46)-N7)-methyltransferase TrmB [Bacteroidetes bacterium GWF2_43_63]HBG70345.1 tRNA (guanosine(46)-N7)-methyltransferase TrmB [Bacteroidales bacterium]HCB60608.1 tRNA (guanosine(46)-N7)-methyltransferase TrmB [Bacteroidales bacterium]HCY22977.1 tRNA (guanosine(46)-N7)-methyltransferase TrmB [Bacteroidales bacterium]